MSILLVGGLNDIGVATQSRLLLDAGFSVTLADLSDTPYRSSIDTRLRVHSLAQARERASMDTGSSARSLALHRRMMRRVRVASARTSYRVMHTARARMGVELESERLALLPTWSGPQGELRQELRVAGLRPGDDVLWFTGVVSRVRPQAIGLYGFVPAGLLFTGARRDREDSLPATVLTLTESDLEALDRDAALATVFRECLPDVTGLIVPRRKPRRFARSLGFKGDLAVTTPNWENYLRPELLRLRDHVPTSKRRIVLVAGTRNIGSSPFVALRALELAADVVLPYQVMVLNAGEGVEIAARLLANRTGIQVVMENPASDADLLQAFALARCSVILSAADRTDPLLHLAGLMGSFPIAGRPCGDNVKQDAVYGLQVNPEDPVSISAAIRRALSDDRLVDSAVRIDVAQARGESDDDQAVDQMLRLYALAAGGRHEER